jgi:hypothetical protein
MGALLLVDETVVVVDEDDTGVLLPPGSANAANAPPATTIAVAPAPNSTFAALVFPTPAIGSPRPAAPRRRSQATVRAGRDEGQGSRSIQPFAADDPTVRPVDNGSFRRRPSTTRGREPAYVDRLVVTLKRDYRAIAGEWVPSEAATVVVGPPKCAQVQLARFR